MAECKNCGGKTNKKNGVVRGKQRYKCCDCGYNFTPGDNRTSPRQTV